MWDVLSVPFFKYSGEGNGLGMRDDEDRTLIVSVFATARYVSGFRCGGDE